MRKIEFSSKSAKAFDEIRESRRMVENAETGAVRITRTVLVGEVKAGGPIKIRKLTEEEAGDLVMGMALARHHAVDKYAEGQPKKAKKQKAKAAAPKAKAASKKAPKPAKGSKPKTAGKPKKAASTKKKAPKVKAASTKPVKTAPKKAPKAKTAPKTAPKAKTAPKKAPKAAPTNGAVASTPLPQEAAVSASAEA